MITDIYEPYALKNADSNVRDELLKDRSMIFVHEMDTDENEQSGFFLQPEEGENSKP